MTIAITPDAVQYTVRFKMSIIKPFEKLLHRELHTHDAKQHLQAQLDLLKSVTDYGTFLIAGTFHTSKKELPEIVVLLVLLKQVVSMLDAIHVLSTNAYSQAALLQMRALFEASVYIDWILHSDTEKKAKYFYVSNLRRERMWNCRAQEGRPEHDSFFKSLGEFGEALEETRNKLGPEAQKQIEAIEKLLSKEEWAEENQAIDDARGKRKHDPAWYEPMGARSFREIAEEMDRLHEYEIFYSQASEKVHGSDYKSHVKFSGGLVTIEPIRSLEGLTTTINFAVSATFHTYQAIINHYRPEQAKEFAEKYLEYWRDPFLNMPDISYKTKNSEPII